MRDWGFDAVPSSRISGLGRQGALGGCAASAAGRTGGRAGAEEPVRQETCGALGAVDQSRGSGEGSPQKSFLVAPPLDSASRGICSKGIYCRRIPAVRMIADYGIVNLSYLHGGRHALVSNAKRLRCVTLERAANNQSVSSSLFLASCGNAGRAVYQTWEDHRAE